MAAPDFDAESVEIHLAWVDEHDRLVPTRHEDISAAAFRLDASGLRAWSECRPRSMSVLPIANACQASCTFCFSKASVSTLVRPSTDMLARWLAWAALARTRGAERAVVSGGGEPTLLPAASTLPAGLEYQIINDTLQAVALRAAGGRRIGTVPPLSQAAVRLLDPAAPVWSVPGQTLHPCAELVVTPGAAAAVRVAPLDSTHALCAWLSGTTIRVVVATIAAGVVTLGGAATIVTGATSVQDIDLAGLSATDGAIVWAETISGPAYRVRCAALTVSGTTATAGTPITIGSLTGSGTTRVAALDTGRVVVVRGCVTPAQTVLTTVGISAGTASAYSDSADLAISSVSGLTLTGIDTARALLTAGTTARVVTCSGTAAPTAGSAASGAGAPGSAAFDGVSGVLLGYPGAAPTALRADVSGTTVTLSAAGYLPVTAAAGTLALLARLAAGDVAVLATPAVADHSQAARIRAASGAPDAVARADIGRITSGASNGTALCALSSGLLLLAAVRPGDSYPVLTPIEVTP